MSYVANPCRPIEDRTIKLSWNGSIHIVLLKDSKWSWDMCNGGVRVWRGCTYLYLDRDTFFEFFTSDDLCFKNYKEYTEKGGD